jgi:flagellar basal-body rod protein FlgF
MPYGMYISAEGANAQSRRLDVIANNMANVDTVGFKQDVTTFMSRYSEAIQKGLAAPGDQSINNVGGGVKVIDVATDWSPGAYEPTNNLLDFAIVGEGFFNIRGDDGKPLLTRAGNFMLDGDGRLVTDGGQQPVLEQQGDEIILNPNVPWSISQDGFLAQDGKVRVLALTKPVSLDDTIKVGNNAFRPLGKVEDVPLGERQIRQGYLEKSAANSVRQMMAMIESTRGFEANSRMIQAQDSATGTLVGRVLRG